MPGMRSSLPAVALVCGALLAGCGGSGSSTSSSSATPKPTPTVTVPSTAASVPSTTTPTGSTPGAGVPGGAAAVAQYAAICSAIVHGAPGLSSSEKAKVESVCAKAAHGDAAGARAAAKEACVEIVEATPVSSALKEKALAGCKGT